MRAIQISQFGGPEVLELVELPDPQPSGQLVVLSTEAAGVNYADTHQAEDSYLARQPLPLIPGGEAVGRLADGRRVVALLTRSGGYAESVLVHPGACFDVPDDVSDAQALALVVQGTSAWHLLRTSAQLRPGESVVVHAAAGGVGSLAVQLAKAFGAGRVIGTASSPDKRELAARLGADAVVDSNDPDLTSALLTANGGRNVDVVLEMTGGRVFDQSLEALAPFGRLVTYGMASREQPAPVEPGRLMATSRGVVGFWLVHAVGLRGGLQPAMDDLIDRVRAGTLRVVDGGRYPLAQARRAHEDLRARRTTGKLVLDVRA